MLMKIKNLTIALLVFSVQLFGQQRIVVTDYGYEPGSRKNVIPALTKALEACKKHSSSVLVFPKGRYDFWQDLSSNRYTIGIEMENLKNVTVDGDSSEFVFHGNMQIVSIHKCENIQLMNFTVDWDFPFMYQGKYVNSTDNFIDIEFDKNQYHYIIEDGKFFMTGEGWKAAPMGYFNLFDRDTKEILYKTYDGNNSDVFNGKAEELGSGVVRFHGKTNIKPPNGTYTTLMAGRYITTGIQMTQSKDIYLKDITLYHVLSHAFYGNRTENITMDNANVKENAKKGRVFSAVADASHFTNCRGLIKVMNCAHEGAMDDFINVHGGYSLIESVENQNTVIVTRERGVGVEGDEVWFVNPESCKRSAPVIIKSVERMATQDNQRRAKVIFATSIPAGLKAGDFIENKTWTASLEVRKCRILKQNRARGILVTTPQKVVIEDNYFRNAGTAILIEGDMDFWYESGAHADFTIRNNVFENCLSSGCSTGDRWQWGEAIITIAPSHRPKNEKSEPYHKNIRIENNVFKTFDIPLVHARSVRGLTFKNNEIIRTYDFKPYLWQKSSFLFDGCREVVISGNKLDVDYTTRTIVMDHMSNQDVKADGFKIVDRPFGKSW